MTKQNATIVDEKNVDEKSTQKTFTIAKLARELGLNEKNVRARLRRIYDHKNDVLLIDNDSTKIVQSHRCKNAKHVWVYRIDARDAMIALLKRDDDA